MTERTKNVLLAVLVVGIVSMTVAYASLSQQLNINGSAKVQNASSSWNVHFAAISEGAECPNKSICPSGYASAEAQTISITSGTTSVTLPKAILKAPGDKVVYRFKVENTGNINAKVTSVGTPTLSSSNFAYGNGETMSASDKTAFESKINVSFKYADNTTISQNDTLNSGANRELIVTIEFDSSATTLPTQDVEISGITASITYGQA